MLQQSFSILFTSVRHRWTTEPFFCTYNLVSLYGVLQECVLDEYIVYSCGIYWQAIVCYTLKTYTIL